NPLGSLATTGWSSDICFEASPTTLGSWMRTSRSTPGLECGREREPDEGVRVLRASLQDRPVAKSRSVLPAAVGGVIVDENKRSILASDSKFAKTNPTSTEPRIARDRGPQECYQTEFLHAGSGLSFPV